jgi:hypothetical protein
MRRKMVSPQLWHLLVLENWLAHDTSTARIGSETIQAGT